MLPQSQRGTPARYRCTAGHRIRCKTSHFCSVFDIAVWRHHTPEYTPTISSFLLQGHAPNIGIFFRPSLPYSPQRIGPSRIRHIVSHLCRFRPWEAPCPGVRGPCRPPSPLQKPSDLRIILRKSGCVEIDSVGTNSNPIEPRLTTQPF
jgi:hypothetical protein